MEQGREAYYSSEESFMTDYKMMMTLGQGHFSKVKLAFHVPTVTCVAVKAVRNEENASLVEREVNIMKSLKHPNIIQLFYVLQSRETTFLVMEYASEGDLLRHILEVGSLEESEVRRLFTQILLAVEYCHSNHIAHRDIKANNILLDSRGDAKLCDFGLAANVTPGQLLKDFCGTLLYCAPELFAEEAYDAYATDMWSLGVLLFLMVVGRFPFRVSSSKRVRHQILAANFTIPQHVSMDIFNVIVELLMINPGRRPTIDQIMKRPMIRDRKTRLPPPSTQKPPGALSPSIVNTMMVMGYKSEERIDSLRDPNYNQVMATYLILQHQSPGGDCCHHQVKSMQPDLVLNLDDLHTFPVPLRRASEPAPLTFTLSSNPQEREHEKNARQCGTRHSMPATLCRHSERTRPPHQVYLNRHCALFLTCSSEEMSENFSESMIGKSGSLRASVHPSSLLMYTASSSPEHNETTRDTGNRASCSYQEEFWSSVETVQSVTPKGSSSHQEATTKEATVTQEEDDTPEMTMTQDDSITEENAITHGQPEVAGPASSQSRRRHRWKGVKRAMVNCLRHLCCCLAPANRSHDSCKNLAPRKQDRGVTHRTSVEEVQTQLRGL
ncbi:sperm motility kinase X-like [Mesocricetus auratus]|uniref:non-specific serine/threonine protein kinase n=1 Tax=Mesocricetus auratus TaxID=10036 RepID=A0ABM2X692_MESAU|nr:sperm motility kinase X-like [Mesocricetus auratus]